MHAFVKKGLLLSAAAGALVLGGAAAASAATSATADGLTADSPGVVSGNTVQVPADIPIQVCGVSVAAVAAATSADDNTCVDDGTSAAAHGTATGSPGALSGNVLQVVLNAPIQACGDAVGVAAYGTQSQGNTCVVGEPRHHPMGPPPVPCPPPVGPPPCPPGTDG